MSLTETPQKEKQPKETDKIKALLKSYIDCQRRIDLAEERLAYLESIMYSPSSPNLTGMPGGSRDRTAKQERDYIKKEELLQKLDDMYVEESRAREQIEGLIELIEKPEERTVIEMHYIDGAKWWPICTVLYENEPDYEENPERYLKRTFKVHGSALLTLARKYEGS